MAFFLNGSPTEMSPPATIFFTPTVLLPEITHFETTPTNTPLGRSHCIYLIIIDIHGWLYTVVIFEVTPSPLTVAVEQGTATFQCQHPLAVVIGWRVNRMSLNMANLLNVSSATHINATTILSIATLLVYNGTIVECIATFIDGSSPQFTAPVALLIQGIHTVIVMYAVRASTIIVASCPCLMADTPKQVKNVNLLRGSSRDELTILWNPLPTLDINDTDPDILYSVELYQITCGQNIFINRMEVAGSNVTEEDLDLMQIYKAVIAARNNVRDATNGPPAKMKGITVY